MNKTIWDLNRAIKIEINASKIEIFYDDALNKYVALFLGKDDQGRWILNLLEKFDNLSDAILRAEKIIDVEKGA